MTRPCALLLLLLLLAAAPARADEVQLRNGDRITGTTVSLTGGTLTFTTSYGTVRIPWADVTALTVQEAIVVTDAAGRATTQQGAAIVLTTVSTTAS